MGVAQERAALLASMENVDSETLRELLALVEALQGDQAALAVVQELRRRDAPISALIAAREALKRWANAAPGENGKESDVAKTRRLYAAEIDDIIRRVAADMAAQG